MSGIQGFSIRCGVGGEGKTWSKDVIWELERSEFLEKFCNLGLLECISSILEQKLVFEQNTDIVKLNILP